MGDSTIAPSSTINPLVSRLDRLDFLMKYLERRTKFEACEGKNNIDVNGGAILMERPNGCLLLPMDLAMKEVESKGSLVDRVAALESRLFQVKRAIIQISLDMDQSSGTSQTSSSGTCSQTSGDSALSLRSRGESSNCSLPTFNYNPNYGNTRISQVHVMTTTHEIEENSDVETLKIVPSDPPTKQKSNKEKKDKKSCKTGKKRTLPNWTHLRLLGC